MIGVKCITRGTYSPVDGEGSVSTHAYICTCTVRLLMHSKTQYISSVLSKCVNEFGVTKFCETLITVESIIFMIWVRNSYLHHPGVGPDLVLHPVLLVDVHRLEHSELLNASGQ